MPIIARDSVTLAAITSLANTRQYYWLRGSTEGAPPASTLSTNPPTGSWSTTEPGYSAGSTSSLYTVHLNVFSDGTFDYLPIQLSSSYEAAKQAWNKAQAAETAAGNAASDASTALTSANGRNQRVAGTTDPPSGTINTITGLPWRNGDTWVKWNNNTNRHVIGQWTREGSYWRAEAIGSTFIANLDLNKLTVIGSTRMNQTVVDKIIGDAGFYKLLTADRVSVFSSDGIYYDPTFQDPGLSALRASNSTGTSYVTATKTMNLGTTGRMWLTREGLDEGVSTPLTVGTSYVLRVSGTGLTNLSVTVKDSGGYRFISGSDVSITNTYIEARVPIQFSDARIELYRSSVGTATVSRVTVNESVGGVLITPNGITSPHIAAGALDFKEANGLVLTSPEIQTSTSANTGIKIVGNTFRAYGSGSTPLIDINGSTGTITGATVRTAASGARVEMTSTGLRAYNSSGNVTASILGGFGTLDGFTVTGGTIRTASSGSRIQMSGSSLTAYTGSTRRVELKTSELEFYDPNGISVGQVAGLASGMLITGTTTRIGEVNSQVMITGTGSGWVMISGEVDIAGTVHINGMEVGTDTGWVKLTLSASWEHVASWNVFVRKVNGIVFIKGLASLVSGHNATNAIATLPAQFRPEGQSFYLQASVASGNKAVVTPHVASTGGIALSASRWTATPTGYIGLTGSWPAAS